MHVMAKGVSGLRLVNVWDRNTLGERDREREMEREGERERWEDDKNVTNLFVVCQKHTHTHTHTHTLTSFSGYSRSKSFMTGRKSARAFFWMLPEMNWSSTHIRWSLPLIRPLPASWVKKQNHT